MNCNTRCGHTVQSLSPSNPETRQITAAATERVAENRSPRLAKRRPPPNWSAGPQASPVRLVVTAAKERDGQSPVAHLKRWRRSADG